MASGPEHYKNAEGCLYEADRTDPAYHEERAYWLARGLVHAALALAAATALCHPDERGYIAADLYRDWHKAAAS